jgi:SSS family solute:Na+ symporter
VAALIVSGIATTAWYLLGNPFGIDNMYVAVVTPAIVLALARLFPDSTRANSTPNPEIPL